MTDRTIASRPSLEQVVAIVDFMENHPALALGQLRGLEGRHRSGKLWSQLTRIVNNLNGPTRSVKSWIKFWSDKKSTVRAKVQSSGGDANSLSSNVDKKIWDKFLVNDKPRNRTPKIKHEEYLDETLYEDTNMDANHDQPDPVLSFEEPLVNTEERHEAIMEKLVKVMSDQAAAMSQLAQASHAQAQAMDRLAEASHIQARAIDRLAITFESIGSATHDVRNAIVGIDTTLKRFYTTSPT